MLPRLVACSLGIVALSAAANAQSLAPQTNWANDHAQLVIQSVDAEGRLSGTYANYGPNFSCAGQAFPVTGWIVGDRISYTVLRRNPGNCTLVQSWTGFVRGGELLVEFMAVGDRDVVLTGTDRYSRQ